MFLRYTILGVSIFLTSGIMAQESVKAKINRTIDITYNVKKLTIINSEYTEFSPTIYNDKIVFSSDRNFDLVNIGENRWKKKKYVNLFVADITIPAQDSVIFSKPALLGDEFISLNHIGPVFFSSDGAEAFLSQDLKEFGHVNKPQLYVLKNDNGKWADKTLLPFVKEEYVFSHPALSEDGKKLFFVSDMPGGPGGKDIFYVERSGESWSEPVALGTEVNSDKDEMFPYFRNNILYFSTNGRESIGGLDLYKSELTSANKWKNAVTLGTTINSAADDFGFVLDKEMRSGFFSSNREGGVGEDDIYYFKVIETVSMISQDIEGKFTYKTLAGGSPEGMEVMLYDDKGEFIGKAVTDKDGYFRFQNLPLEKEFTIRTAENGNTLILSILDSDGEATAFLLSDKTGAFVYKKLGMDYTGTLALMEVEETEIGPGGKMSGQFVYEQISLGEAGGLNVYLVDDDGKIIYKTKTDKYGNFEFKNLPVGSNYIIKTDANNSDMTLFVFNKDNEVIAQMRMNEQGEFLYRKLNPNYAHISFMEAGDTEQLAPKSNNIEGDFVYKSMKGGPAAMNFEILNDNNEIIYKGTTDEKGGFFVTNLPLSENYLFRIAADDPNFDKDMDLILKSRTNIKIATLVKDENGIFIFKRLATGDTVTSVMENTDISNISTTTTTTTNNNNNNTDPDFEGKSSVIYFDLNSSFLSEENKSALNDIVSLMKKDKLIKVVIDAHTDSRADENYNKWLSDRRLKAVKNYLVSQGISAGRIKGNSYGESQLVNKCADGVECADEDHLKNRRVEMNFLK